MVRDFKSNVSGDLDYMEHLQDLHKMSRDILYSLDDEGIFIDFCRFLHLCDLRYTRRIYNFQEKSRIKLFGGVMVMKQIWNQSNLSNLIECRPESKMSSEKFCLKWNDFETNISSAFKDLREDKDFFDVTIACKDDQIQAHKVILSACSPFFRDVLKRNLHQHPLLYLKSVNYLDFASVLNFMYHGEVNVAQESLNTFLSVAEELKVKGLTQGHSKHDRKDPYTVNNSGNRTGHQISSNTNIPLKEKPQSSLKSSSSHSISNQAADDDIQEVCPIKTEPREIAPASSASFTPKPIETSQHNLYSSQDSQSLASHSLATADETYAMYDDSYDDYGQYDDQINPGIQNANGETSGYDLQDPSELLQFVRQDPADQKYYCTLCVGISYCHKASANDKNSDIIQGSIWHALYFISTYHTNYSLKGARSR